MLQILQVLNYMIQQGYSDLDIDDTFVSLLNNDYCVSELYDVLGLEVPNDLSHFERSLPKWESAYHILKLKHGLAG